MPQVTYPTLPYDCLICRYSEIATKGRNRVTFENLLVSNLLGGLNTLRPLEVIRERGRIFIRPPRTVGRFDARACAIIERFLPRVAGLSSGSLGFLIEPTLASAREIITRTFGPVYAAFEAAFPGDGPIPYRLRVQRSDKRFPMTATQIECHFADLLLPAYPRLKVDLKKPALRVELEIRNRRAFVCYDRIPGPGGLPTGSGGKVLALLSGGIDSPVACYQMMRRGCTVDFITFHSTPYTPPELLAKVARMAILLNTFQPPGRLVVANLLPLQKAVRDHCQSRFRTVLYRRYMMRIASKVARCLKAEALVTGDNIGQVASQTLPNLAVISAATPVLILRPLLTADKQDTTAVARTIGSLDISREEIPDSCTVFAPKNPATVSFVDRILREEASLASADLIRQCLEQTRLLDPETLEETPLEGLKRLPPSSAADQQILPRGT